MSESRPPVRHIEREGDMAVQHVLDTGNHHPGIARLVLASPMVEPSAPELAAHQRSIGACLFQLLELGIDISSCPEVDRPDQIIQTVQLESRAPVTLEQRDIRKACRLHRIADIGDIRLVGSICPILVLDLYHDDIPAPGHLQVSQLLADLVHEQLRPFEEIGIVGTELDILLLQQPPGQSAHLPLRADIRAGTQHDIHAFFLGQPAKSGNIVLPLEIELARFLLMDIPERIDTDRVHAECLAHLNTMLPVFGGDTGVMYLRRLNHKWFAIQQEGSLPNRKIVLLPLSGTAS